MKKVEKAQKAKHVFGLEEKLLLGIVGVSVLMIIAAFSVKLLPTPTEQADAKLEEMIIIWLIFIQGWWGRTKT